MTGKVIDFTSRKTEKKAVDLCAGMLGQVLMLGRGFSVIAEGMTADELRRHIAALGELADEAPSEAIEFLSSVLTIELDARETGKPVRVSGPAHDNDPL